jgi:MoxR-like ATPase
MTAAPKNTSAGIHPALPKIQAIQADLNARFRQRGPVIQAMLASLLASELVLLIGPRGEAKTAIVEALSEYISDGKHFSVGLAKSSTPDDILGGVDVLALQHGTYRRNTDGFLPEATTFLLDEGFKSNNPTLQALLRVLSEREFQGQPIRALFGAICSNELPPELRGQKKGKSADLGPFEDSLLAFFDRFFHKLEVEPLGIGSGDWNAVVFDGVAAQAAAASVTVAEIEALQALVDSVALPTGVQDAMREVATVLAAGDAGGVVTVSTRTWRKATRMLRAHALLAGRMTVQRADLRILESALWTTPDQRPVIKEAIIQRGSPELSEALAVEQRVSELVAAYGQRRVQVSQTGDLSISEQPVSAMAAAASTETLAAFLKQQGNELRAISAKSNDDTGEVDRVIAFVDAQRGKLIDEITSRLRSH